MLCAQAWKPSSQHAGEKRGVAGLLLGRPTQVEGTQGSLPQPEKDLESPSSMRLEARFAYYNSRAITHSPSPHARLGLALGSPIFPSGCEGKLGADSGSLPGKVRSSAAPPLCGALPGSSLRSCRPVPPGNTGSYSAPKDSQGLSRVAAGNPGFPGLEPVTSGNFSGCGVAQSPTRLKLGTYRDRGI